MRTCAKSRSNAMCIMTCIDTIDNVYGYEMSDLLKNKMVRYSLL